MHAAAGCCVGSIFVETKLRRVEFHCQYGRGLYALPHKWVLLDATGERERERERERESETCQCEQGVVSFSAPGEKTNVRCSQHENISLSRARAFFERRNLQL